MSVEHNPDGRPLSQLFYDDIWAIIKKYEDSGLENCQAVGVLEMLKHDHLVALDMAEAEDEDEII